MVNYNGQAKNFQYQTPNVTILDYAMALLSEKRITQRQAMLLGRVDQACAPVLTKRWPAKLHKDMPISFLTRVLNVNHDNLNLLILGLIKIRPRIFWSKRLDKNTWRFRTHPKKYRLGHDAELPDLLFRVLASAIDEMAEFGITPLQAMILSAVASYTMKGQKCWERNITIANNLGSTGGSISNAISDLEKKGRILVHHVYSMEEFNQVIGRNYFGEEYKKRNKWSRYRFLEPVNEALFTINDEEEEE